MQNGQSQSILTEEDLASAVLADLKRVVREYATAATESTCPDIRQMFTKLTNDTLTAQGQLFTAMEQNNMYTPASPVLKQEMDKQIQEYKQTQQKTMNQLQAAGTSGNIAQFAAMQQNQSQQQGSQPAYS